MSTYTIQICTTNPDAESIVYQAAESIVNGFGWGEFDTEIQVTQEFDDYDPALIAGWYLEPGDEIA